MDTKNKKVTKSVFGCLGLFILIVIICTSCVAIVFNEEDKEVKTFNFTINDLEKRINTALTEMGDNTNLKAGEVKKMESDEYGISLSENIFIFIYIDKESNKVKEVTLGANPDALVMEKEDLNDAFLLLVGTADDSLSFGDRNIIVKNLGLKESNLSDHTGFVDKNNIRYTYNGNEDGCALKSTPK